jgi:hypothetical protein
VVALRSEQNEAKSPADREAVCRRHRERSDAAPSNLDLLYVALRCRPKGPDRDRAVLEASARAPTHPWLSMFAGFTHARRGEWDEALASFRTARAYPGMPEGVAIEFARILRLRGAGGGAELERLAETSMTLKQMLMLESPVAGSGAPEVYAKLARGQLVAALGEAGPAPERRARVLRLVAASRGATSSDVAAALSLGPSEGIDGHTIWPAIALLKRHGRDATALLSKLDEFVEEEEREAARRFFDPRALLDDAGAAGEAANQLSPMTRGHAYVAACVILGDDAPEPWRTAARALLFAPERPSL